MAGAGKHGSPACGFEQAATRDHGVSPSTAPLFLAVEACGVRLTVIISYFHALRMPRGSWPGLVPGKYHARRVHLRKITSTETDY
jgi:hypothetical protein